MKWRHFRVNSTGGASIYYDNNVSPPGPQITVDLADAIAEYGEGLTTVISQMSGNYSDHAPFAEEGFDAALLIEYAYWTNPHYHKLTDAVETDYLDYTYATRMTRGAVGYLATAAALVPEPGTVTLLGSGLVVVALWVLRRRPEREEGERS